VKELLSSKRARVAALVIGGTLLFLAGFAGGMAAGFHKARFSYVWGEQYERNFTGPRPRTGIEGFRDRFEGRGFRNPHGLAGEVISVMNDALVVKDREGKENTVAVTDRTVIRRWRDVASLGDIGQGDRIVVLGGPGEDGTVNADLIRIFEHKQ
jgi:hypothetical protein